MSRHFVVVGAGGLTAAALLARAGVRVTVLERLGHLGGRTANFVQDGFRFDHGPTFFHYPQVLEAILHSWGRLRPGLRHRACCVLESGRPHGNS